MKSLTRYLDNPFANDDLALDDLLAFTTDHLGRLRSRNADGQNDALVGPLESALAGLTAAMGQDGTRLGQRKARKHVKRHFRREVLPPGLKRVEGGIVAYLEGAAEVLKKAFPHGRRLFHRCADDLLRAHLATVRAVVLEHAAELPPAVPELVQDLVTQWQAVYAGSESSSGVKSAAEEALRQARAAVARVLFENLLRLGLRHPGRPERLAEYMQESLLRPPRRRRARPDAALGLGG